MGKFKRIILWYGQGYILFGNHSNYKIIHNIRIMSIASFSVKNIPTYKIFFIL